MTSTAVADFYTVFRCHREWTRYASRMQDVLSVRRQQETALQQEGDFTMAGCCYPCHASVSFDVTYRYAYPIEGVLRPNWREQVLCPRCHLNSRMRACVHLLETVLAPARDHPILVAEQTTPMYRWLASRYTQLVGFEYLSDRVPFGQVDERGIRCETLTALTFGDRSATCMLAFDVLEHVPEFRRALDECRRVLRPGGAFVCSVPFLLDTERTLVRARYTNGQLEHLLPPEYHGDPLSDSGCLAFYHFGWELLADFKEAGFADVSLYHCWSDKYGYLGHNQAVLVGRV